MTDLADFLADALPRQVETESAWHQGDLDARLVMWSTREPVTLFGAGRACRSGSDEVQRIFRTAVTQIIPCRSFTYDLVAAGVGGELAYTVGYEHTSFDPGPVQDYTLRVTYLYRREGGEWKVIHRHGDYLASTTGHNEGTICGAERAMDEEHAADETCDRHTSGARSC